MKHLSYYLIRDKTMTTPKITKKRLMYVGGAAVLLTLGLIGVVQLSEYNQMRAKCAELEEGIQKVGEEMIVAGERMQQLERYAEKDPWGAFNYLDEALNISLNAMTRLSTLEASVKEYEKTCPLKRQEEFKLKPEMRRIGERLSQFSK